MKPRRYTGNKDGAAKGRRAGMVEFIAQIVQRSDGALWNNGDYGIRDMRSKAGVLSVHASGRAVDLSWRHVQIDGVCRGKPKGRAAALAWRATLIRHADLLGIELLIDYFPKPHGGAYKCSRQKFVKYDVKMVSGAPNGDWFHIELSPAMSDDPVAVRAAFTQIFLGVE